MQHSTNHIRRYRDQLDLSQDELAQEIGRSRNTVQSWERDGIASPNDLYKLTELFVSQGVIRDYETAVTFWDTSQKRREQPFPVPPELRHLFDQKDEVDQVDDLEGFIAVGIDHTSLPPDRPIVGTVKISAQPVTGHEPDNRGTKHVWAFLIVALVATLVVVLLMVNFGGGTRPVPEATPISIGSTCGEVEREPAKEAARLLRSQGVSAYTVNNTDGALLNDNVRSVAIDHRGLWIGYFATEQNSATGLGHFDKRSWVNCDQPGGPVGTNVNAIAVDQAGKVWLATEAGGIATFDGTTWRTYTTLDGLPSNQTYGITVDEQDNVWVGTWEGVAKFDGTRWSTPYTVHNNTVANNHVHAIAFDTAGNTWIGHINHGVSQYRAGDGKWLHYTTETSGLGGNQIRSIVIQRASDTSDESIWFATADGGVSRLQQGAWTVFRAQDGLRSNEVRALAIDRENRVWAATAGGATFFNGSTWETYTTISTHSIAFGPSCEGCPYNDDHVWTGTAELGLTHSRTPFTDQVIDIIKVSYPKVVAPRETFRPEIVVAPRSSHQLREDRGDFLSNVDESDANLFGAHVLMPVKGVIEPGQPFTFTDYDNPFQAPELGTDEQEMTFTSTWRVWMNGRYVSPPIRITFTVRRPVALEGDVSTLFE